MTVQKMYVNNQEVRVTGVGYMPEGDFMVNESVVDPYDGVEMKLLMQAGVLCNNSKLVSSEEEWSVIGDPTEGCLLTMAKKSGMVQEHLAKLYPRKQELVFDSDRKRMSTINEMDGELVMFTKGAVDSMLEICNRQQVNGKSGEVK